MSHPFEISGRYYDLLYGEKDVAAEVSYLKMLLQRHGNSGQSLLEFGSGTGRHGRRLAAGGYVVHGIERSSTMLAAVTPTPGFSCQLGDITTVRLERQFDAVLAVFHVISYQIDDRTLQATLANAACHLAPGGLFVFDIWYSPAVIAQGVDVRVKRVENTKTSITRIAEPIDLPNANRVDVNYTYFVKGLEQSDQRSFHELHSMRHFSLPELNLLAKGAGFEPVAAEEWLTGSEPSEHSWSVCLVWRRR